jgi:hypothetical protein
MLFIFVLLFFIFYPYLFFYSSVSWEAKRLILLVVYWWILWVFMGKIIYNLPFHVSVLDLHTFAFLFTFPVFAVVAAQFFKGMFRSLDSMPDSLLRVDVRSFFVISCVFCVPYLYVLPKVSVAYLKYGEQARNLIFKENTLIFPNLYMAEIHSFLFVPVLFMLVVLGVLLWLQTRKVFYLLMAGALTSLDVLAGLGRMPLWEFFIVICVAFLMFRGEVIFKLKSFIRFRVLLVGGILLLAAAALTVNILNKRFEGEAFNLRTITQTILGSQNIGYPLCSLELAGEAPSSQFLGKGYGRATFGAFDRFSTLFIRRLDPGYVPFTRDLSMIQNQFVPIGYDASGDSQYANAYFTIIGTFASDFGKLGPLWGGGIVGILVGFFSAMLQRSGKFIWYFCLVWMCYFLMRGILNSPLHGYVFAFGLIAALGWRYIYGAFLLFGLVRR